MNNMEFSYLVNYLSVQIFSDKKYRKYVALESILQAKFFVV